MNRNDRLAWIGAVICASIAIAFQELVLILTNRWVQLSSTFVLSVPITAAIIYGRIGYIECRLSKLSDIGVGSSLEFVAFSLKVLFFCAMGIIRRPIRGGPMQVFPQDLIFAALLMAFNGGFLFTTLMKIRKYERARAKVN